ncbi:MAG: hypothetical protein LBR80_12975 [Deltaproteobacteria bacterium]|jgi:hypothetical protein|nr:hypothetical protein [Deltaproteobacteria bacterium]
MRVSACAAALAVAAALLAASWSLPADAQWLDHGDNAALLTKAGAASKAVPVTAEESLSSHSCPDKPFPISVVYPQGFDGNGPVDLAVKALADRFLAEAISTGEEALADLDGCDGLEYYQYSVGSLPAELPGKAYSVLWRRDSNTGGAHPVFDYVSQTLKADGTELLASDLFPDPAKSLPLLWKRIFADTCAKGNGTAASYYGSPECGSQAPPLPEALVPGATLDGLGHALLTTQGLILNLDPYEGWSWADGEMAVEIPTADLIAMGADPKLWQ